MGFNIKQNQNLLLFLEFGCHITRCPKENIYEIFFAFCFSGTKVA